MGKFICFIKQDGEGCDYTIGCGLNLLQLKSTNMDDAIQEMKDIIKEEYNHYESKLGFCTVYEVSETHKLNVKGYYNQLESEKFELKKKLQEEKERQEFERLKKKFGN